MAASQLVMSPKKVGKGDHLWWLDVKRTVKDVSDVKGTSWSGELCSLEGEQVHGSTPELA